VLGSRKVLVNLANLVDHRNIGTPVIRFKNYNEFWQYRIQPSNTYLKKKTKKDRFISALLRKL
jgi:hypothetical protein